MLDAGSWSNDAVGFIGRPAAKWFSNNMSNSFKRRRKRGSGSGRSASTRLIPFESVRSPRIGRVELAASGGVALVGFVLIALIWIVTIRTEQDVRVEIRDRAEQALVGQAATIAETVMHELLLIDQSLIIIQTAWKDDSDTVDLSKWRKKMPALTAVADDLFIADEKHIIRQDILPQAIGQGIGSAYVTFPHGSLEELENDGTKKTDSSQVRADTITGGGVEARQSLMYIVRPLDHPKGWLLGASFRSAELTKLFAQSALGFNPVVALVDTSHGMVQAVVGPAARRPKIDMSKSPLFGLIKRSPAGTWVGTTSIDDVERLHAFHRVGDRDMAVVVAANWSEVMEPANNLAAGARSLAVIATGLVLAIGAIVLWQLYSVRDNRRQKRILERNRGELARLRAEEITTTARAKLNAARLQSVLDHSADGIALFDANLHLMQWNRPFSHGIGIVLEPNMPLDTMLRSQAAAGLFGPIEDIEYEVARRAGILKAGDSAGLVQPGPAQEEVVLRGLVAAEGGFILLLNGILAWQPPVPPSPSIDVHEATAPEPTASPPIEW
jgi:PAS domain-containing protein